MELEESDEHHDESIGPDASRVDFIQLPLLQEELDDEDCENWGRQGGGEGSCKGGDRQGFPT